METVFIGIAAVAAVVQAVGVIVALVYAARQIVVARETSARARRDELIDRLEAAVFDDLLTAVLDQREAWEELRQSVHRLDAFLTDGDDRQADTAASAIAAARKRLSVADRHTRHMINRVERLTDWLEEGVEMEPIQQLARAVENGYSPRLLPHGEYDLINVITARERAEHDHEDEATWAEVNVDMALDDVMDRAATLIREQTGRPRPRH